MRYLILFILSISISTGAYAQRFVRETRNLFNTFGSKITKVVLPSNTLPDLMLRDAINKGWRISPFEFCTIDEYNRIKDDTSFFFLMRVDGRYQRDLEPRVEYITLFRGGPEQKGGTFSSKDIITLPLQAFDDPTGQNLHLLHVYTDIIQNHIYKVQQDVSLAFKGRSFYADRVREVKERELMIARDFLAFSITEQEFAEMFKNRAKLVDSDDIEDAVINNSSNTVVSVLIKPRGDARRSFCYKLLIGTDTHELLFFRRHRITTLLPAGFTREDIRKISVPFQF